MQTAAKDVIECLTLPHLVRVPPFPFTPSHPVEYKEWRGKAIEQSFTFYTNLQLVDVPYSITFVSFSL